MCTFDKKYSTNVLVNVCSDHSEPLFLPVGFMASPNTHFALSKRDDK
jgi:hypothetical protein